MVSNGNINGPIQVSTDEYLKLLTERELNRKSSKMRGDRATLGCRTRK
jgi:hypothetical protein